MGGILMLLLTLTFSASIFWPQPGYIHPDEFFQSTEVIAGDIFNISHLRTWEFQPEMPLRDISVPYVLFGASFYLLRAVLRFLQNHHLLQYIVESYVVLILPRIILALAGIVNYRLVKKLCRVFAVDQSQAVWYWLTSYVTWTFLVRSFSNTTETLLFSVVSFLLVDSALTIRNLRQGSTEAMQGGLASVAREERKVKLYSFIVGCVLCMGFFNRPTFCVFVLAPLVWWLDQLSSAKLRKTFEMAAVLLTGAGFVLMFVLMSVSNSLYYNPNFSHLLHDLLGSIMHADSDAVLHSAQSVVGGLKIPPWSFIQYNLLAVNLAQHGLHPWYTHFLVNIPLLLGPLALLFFIDLMALLIYFQQKHSTDVLYATVIIPVISLSFFPHQEARFLLPVVPFAVVCASKNGLARWKSFKAVVLFFNIIAFVLFGWLHQGGVIPALSALQSHLKKASADPANFWAHYHVISYTTYMPPRHLLFTTSSEIQLHVHDMIGAHNHPPTLKLRTEKLKTVCVNESLICHFFLLVPTPAELDVTSIEGWQVKEQMKFCPHVSMERLPTNFSLQTWDGWYDLMSQLCLKVMLVTL